MKDNKEKPVSIAILETEHAQISTVCVNESKNFRDNICQDGVVNY